MIVWAPFSAPTLDTCQTAPSEPQFCPLRLEFNCSGCPDPARGCLQVLDKQKNRNLRQLCPDPSRPSVGRYRNCVSTSERQTTPGRPGKSKMLQQWDNRVIYGNICYRDDRFSGEVGRSWRYCNVRPTRDGVGASSWPPSPFKNQFNIEENTWFSYQILSW